LENLDEIVEFEESETRSEEGILRSLRTCVQKHTWREVFFLFFFVCVAVHLRYSGVITSEQPSVWGRGRPGVNVYTKDIGESYSFCPNIEEKSRRGRSYASKGSFSGYGV
jgi:hypothetical protein